MRDGARGGGGKGAEARASVETRRRGERWDVRMWGGDRGQKGDKR